MCFPRKGVLVSAAAESDYGGDVAAAVAWQALVDDPRAVLVDVRTTAEWTFVGVPDLAGIGKDTQFVAWSEFPAAELEPFAARLRRALEPAGVAADAPIYFICRSGQRSRNAAIAATADGFRACFNVLEGFEGHLDEGGHRGTAGSWKAEGLPWRQT